MSLKELLIWIMGFSILITPVVLLVSLTLLTWLTPKSVIDQYVRPPHFSEFESIAYRYFPSSWIRTLLFSMAISVPPFRKIRRFGPMNEHVPLWFSISSRVFVYLVLGYTYSFVLVMLLLAAYLKWFK